MLTTIPTSLDKKETRRYRNDGAERKQTERSPRREPWLGSKSGGPLPHTGINRRLPRHYRESGNPVFLVSWIPARAGCRQLGRSGGKVLLRIYETPHWVAARASMVTLLKPWVKTWRQAAARFAGKIVFPSDAHRPGGFGWTGFGPKARAVSRCGRCVRESARWRASSLTPCFL